MTEDFSSIPMDISGWTGYNGEADKESLRILSTCSILSRDYEDFSGDRVNLSIVYGRELGDFHQPEICLKGAGWKQIRSGLVTVRPVGMKPHQATVITLRKDLDDIVMVYWFYMNGVVSPAMAKQGTLFHALAKGELKPSAMVKFTSIVNGDEETARKSSIRLAETLESSIVRMASRPPKYRPSEEALK